MLLHDVGVESLHCGEILEVGNKEGVGLKQKSTPGV